MLTISATSTAFIPTYTAETSRGRSLGLHRRIGYYGEQIGHQSNCVCVQFGAELQHVKRTASGVRVAPPLSRATILCANLRSCFDVVRLAIAPEGTVTPDAAHFTNGLRGMSGYGISPSLIG